MSKRTSAPPVRIVDALAPTPAGDGTQAFFRALEDADYAIEQRDRLQARIDELEAELRALRGSRGGR